MACLAAPSVFFASPPCMFLSPPSLQYAPAPPNSLLSPAFQLVQWKPPLLACCLKLNFDGSVYHDGSGRASIGGVIRDNTGRVRAAFAERTEHAPPGIVEARALIRGLQLALRHFPGCWLVVEGDDLMLVKLLRGEYTERRIPPATQQEIIRLLGQFPACQVDHILREGNQVADALCHEAYQQPGNREWVGDVRLPQTVWEKARDDAQGVEYVRICKPKPPRCDISIPSLVC